MFDALTPEEWAAIELSLRVATVAMLGSLPFGICVAWLLARGRFPGRALVDGIVHLPLVMPPVVTGYLLLLAFGRRGPIGAFLEQHLRHRARLQLDRRGARRGDHGLPADGARHPPVDRGDRPAARSRRGDARRQPARRASRPITLPLMLPGILAGAVLSFARALGEFGATITFVGNIPGVTQTIPTAIYTYTQVPGGERPALRLTLIAIAIAFAALLALRGAGAARRRDGCSADDARGRRRQARSAISRSTRASRATAG